VYAFKRVCRNLALLPPLACCTLPVHADQAQAPPAGHLNSIVVTGKRPWAGVPDAELTERLETAMHSDRFFYDEHVTVVVKDGVVTLRGIVFDEWDLRNAKRIARKIPGVKRVIDDLEIKLGGE